MYRILLNMPSQHAGRQSGVARVAFTLLEHLLDSAKFEYVLRSPWTRDQIPAALQNSPLEVVTVPRPKAMIFDVFAQLATVPIFCRQNNIDLVLNIDPYGAARGGRARIMVVHDLYFKTIAQSTGWREALTSDIIYRVMLAGNRDIIAVSKSTLDDLVRYYPEAAGRASVIYQAGTLTSREINEGAEPRVSGRYVLAVGNATHNKNFGALGRAMRIVRQTHPDTRVVHVGEDRHDTIAEGLGDDSTTALIRLTGIGDAELLALYRHAACLCVTSISEGFCLPVLEAQQAGCPVVCSDRSATPEVAGGAALTFDPEDHQALSRQLIRLLDADFPRREFIAKGYANAARFSWKQTAAAYEAAITGALAKHLPVRLVHHS